MMKKIISIEKVSNGFIVTNGNLKRVYDSSPLEFELDQIHQMLYNSKEGDSHTIVIEVDPPVSPHRIMIRLSFAVCFGIKIISR